MSQRDNILISFLQQFVRYANGTPTVVTDAGPVWDAAVERVRDAGFYVTPDNVLHFGNVAIANLAIQDLVSNNALHLEGVTQGSLNVNSALLANSSTHVNGKVEGALSVLNAAKLGNKFEAALDVSTALTANNATNAYGKAEGALNANSALSANNSTYLNGKLEAALDVNTAVTAANAVKAYGKTEGQINANSATTAGNATLLGGQLPSHYLDAANLTGTVPTARLGSGTANSTTFLAGDNSWKSVSGSAADPANTTANGLMTFVDQSFAGVKTFTANVIVQDSWVTANVADVKDFRFNGSASPGLGAIPVSYGGSMGWTTSITLDALDIANGGRLNLGAGAVLQLNGANGTAGYVLTSNGDASPVWAPAAATVPEANTTVNGTITTATQSFAGVKTFTENVAVSKAVSVTGNVAITGNTTLTGNLVSGNTIHNGTLTANGATTVNGALTIKGTLTANAALGSAGQFLTSGAAANSYWSTPPDANSTVNGYMTTGAQSFAGVKTFEANVAMSQALVVSGNGTVSGNLTVTGNGTVSSNLSVTKALAVSGNAAVTGNLTVTGTVILANTISANGGVGTATWVLTSGGAGANAYWAAAGGSVPDANTTVNGSITTTTQAFAGNKTFNGTMLLNGVTTVNNNLIVNGTVSAANAGAVVVSNTAQFTNIVTLQANTVANNILMTGKMLQYNGITTAGMGVPCIVNTMVRTAQTASSTGISLYTPTVSGLFRISVYAAFVKANQAATITTMHVGCNGANNVGGNTVIMTSNNTGNTAFVAANVVGRLLTGQHTFYATTGNAITLSINMTNTSANSQYDAHATLEALTGS